MRIYFFQGHSLVSFYFDLRKKADIGTNSDYPLHYPLTIIYYYM